MMKLNEAKQALRQHGIGSLVTKQAANPKLAKSLGGWYNCGISLAPAKTSGHNVCPMSTPQCRAACLGNWGQAEHLDSIKRARINRTKLFFQDRQLFQDCLFAELDSIDRYANKHGLRVAFRPNILSDIQWHNVMPELFQRYNDWQFYSYTKVKRTAIEFAEKRLPDNYYIIFSWSERCTADEAIELVRLGCNVAIPFYPVLPSHWNGIPVVDGDKHDLRFLDPYNSIVGLKVKLPKAKTKQLELINATDGFFVRV